MPENFLRCVKNGGKVRTIAIKKGKYMHVCYDKQGRSFHGEVKTKKK